jgi:hypothetical protein
MTQPPWTGDQQARVEGVIEPLGVQSLSPATNPPPGWYPQSGQQRYWDGSAWTEHTAPTQQTLILNNVAAVAPLPQYNTALIVVAWVLAVLTLGYMLPWAVAETRGRPNSLAIGLLNFLVGWTLIGWIAALVMACSAI